MLIGDNYHAVLADKIRKRDRNCPQSGDRIEYIAVKIPNMPKGLLQGGIETPKYIKENNLKIDYKFYITNQIMKPALQFLELALVDAPTIFDKFKKIFELEKLKEESDKLGRTSLMGFIS